MCKMKNKVLSICHFGKIHFTKIQIKNQTLSLISITIAVKILLNEIDIIFKGIHFTIKSM